MSNQTEQPPRGRGRPRIYENKAAWLKARRDRRRAQRAEEFAQRLAWSGVKGEARRLGALDGTETEMEAMEKIISKIN
jgi:hypothetical protein